MSVENPYKVVNWLEVQIVNTVELDIMHQRAANLIREQAAQIASQQAKIDALMLEYCPEEMTKEQIDNWAAHQRVVKVGEI